MAAERLIRIEARIVRLVGVALGLGLIAMVVVNVISALGRYSGWYAFVGADELLVYGMIWIVMLGSILAARTRDHLSVNLATASATGRTAAVLRLAVDAITVAVSGFVAWHSFSFIDRIAPLNQKSMGLGIPMVLPHSAVLVGFAGIAAVTAFLTLVDLLRLAQRRAEDRA